jgi:cytochrome bd-type quinol oxidase subunit 1
MVKGNADLIKEQRRQRFFDQWSRIRAEGVFKFGLKVTTLFALSVFVTMSVWEWLENGIADRKRLLVRFVMSVIFGVILSAISWWTNEGRYKNILIDNRIRARETQ